MAIKHLLFYRISKQDRLVHEHGLSSSCYVYLHVFLDNHKICSRYSTETLNFSNGNWYTKLIHQIDTPNWYTKLIHQINTPNWYTKLIHQINTPNWYTKLIHQIDTPNWYTKRTSIQVVFLLNLYFRFFLYLFSSWIYLGFLPLSLNLYLEWVSGNMIRQSVYVSGTQWFNLLAPEFYI